MERICKRPDMPQRLGAFRDPFDGRILSATLSKGLISMQYINSETEKPVVVPVEIFNDWYLKILVPVPMRMDRPVKD